MKKIRIAALQFSCTWNLEKNLDTAERLVRQAASQDANIILLPELFHSPYFCKDKDVKHFKLAYHIDESPPVKRMRKLAKELEVVLPVSFYEKSGPVRFNSIAMIDADGTVMGVYRKTHIPDAPGYDEKYYFSPGDTGFKVWDTRYGCVGAGICWDQWFPEAARDMLLQGAEIIFYPTAIGSHPGYSDWDSSRHWQRVMQGHAAANLLPIVAANRYGLEEGETCSVSFYGTSFICDYTGAIRQEADKTGDAVLVQDINREEIKKLRSYWGAFRDRRPECYHRLMTLDGISSGKSA
ncbi:MAG: N-carbamoylputrescine amidase [Desulfobacterales bacterium]|nr:N-carbamoylputrescine amidase [Desulfobacterales bacterium]